MYISIDVVLIILFSVCIAVGIYIFILIGNLNSAVYTIKMLLNSNQEDIKKTLKNMPVISDNVVEITNVTKDELKSIQNTLHRVGVAADITADAAHTAKSGFAGKLVVILEVITLIKNFLVRNKIIKDEKKEPEKEPEERK